MYSRDYINGAVPLGLFRPNCEYTASASRIVHCFLCPAISLHAYMHWDQRLHKHSSRRTLSFVGNFSICASTGLHQSPSHCVLTVWDVANGRIKRMLTGTSYTYIQASNTQILKMVESIKVYLVCTNRTVHATHLNYCKVLPIQ